MYINMKKGFKEGRMKKKLQVALMEKKEIELKKSELYKELLDLQPIVRKTMTDKEKEDEVKRVTEHIKEYRRLVLESIPLIQKIQRAGFEGGIKDKLVELNELRFYHTVLKRLLKGGPMGKREWRRIKERYSYGRNDLEENEEVYFYPVDLEWVKEEEKRIRERIKKLNIEIQELNWSVEVDL